MFISKTFKTALYNLGAATILMSSFSVSADVPEQLHYMVSPPSCQPESSADEARLNLVNGVWALINDSTTTTANLVCPLSFYGNVGEFNNFQLWYVAQADSPYSIVQASLMVRNRTSSGSSEIASTSSQDAVTDGYGHVNNFNINTGPETGKNYYVRVLLFRNNNQEPSTVAFTGLAIDIQ